MPSIIWRPVPGLPPCTAQDGTTLIGSNGHAVKLVLEVRPGRNARSRRSILTLTVDGYTYLFASTMRDCKGAAEQIICKMQAEIGKSRPNEIASLEAAH